MGGGTSCGGWQGPRMHFPEESFGNLAADPPSPDFRSLVPLETLSYPLLAPAPMSRRRARPPSTPWCAPAWT